MTQIVFVFENLLDSCESWLFTRFFNLFRCFVNFKHTTSDMVEERKEFGTLIQLFLPVPFKIIKVRENLSSRNSLVCNSLDVSNIIFFVKIRSNFL